MKLIDTHCHLDFSCFDQDRDQLMQIAKQKGIETIIIPSISLQHIDYILELSQTKMPNHPELKIAFGMHPCFMEIHQEKDGLQLDFLLEKHREKVIAIGECGLDFFTEALKESQEKQLIIFKKQLELADQYQLPLIIHARKSLEHILLLIKAFKARKKSIIGVIHSFSGSLVQAQRLVDLGFYFGFGGTITYPNANNLRKLVKSLPLERILLESDAPDQPPFAQRGQRNTPLCVLDACQEIARIREESVENIAWQTTQNYKNLFEKS